MSWIGGEKHPWEEAVERLRKRGEPITPENVKKELESHGYYFRIDSKTILVRDNPRILAAAPDLFSILSGNIKRPRKGVKPINYLPEADVRLEAAVVAYNLARKVFGNDLRAFAVVGGTLTSNISGIPVKVQKIVAPALKGGFRTKMRRIVGVVDDLDIAIVLSRKVAPEEQKQFAKLFEEELRRRGIPKVVLDDSRPFIFHEEDWESLAHFFHPYKPVAFFEGRQYVQNLIQNMLKNPKGKELIDREISEYEIKLREYNKFLPERLEKAFKTALNTKNALERRENRLLAEQFEILYKLVDSKPVRWLVDHLMMRYAGKVDTQRLRYALAHMLYTYLQISQNVIKFSREDVEKFVKKGHS